MTLNSIKLGTMTFRRETFSSKDIYQNDSIPIKKMFALKSAKC
jgi:hypothetical protein